MANTVQGLDKHKYPLMMHLSIVPRYELDDQDFIYDAKSQISVGNVSMGKSWCTRNSSTYMGLRPRDEDSQEDD
jgi:hypothetical protein